MVTWCMVFDCKICSHHVIITSKSFPDYDYTSTNLLQQINFDTITSAITSTLLTWVITSIITSTHSTSKFALMLLSTHACMFSPQVNMIDGQMILVELRQRNGTWPRDRKSAAPPPPRPTRRIPGTSTSEFQNSEIELMSINNAFWGCWD